MIEIKIYPPGLLMVEPIIYRPEGTWACDEHATDHNAVIVAQHWRPNIDQSLHDNGYMPADWERSHAVWLPFEEDLALSEEVMPRSGMKVSEAVTKARRWWEDGGRAMLSRRLNEATNIEEIGRRVVASSGKCPGFVVQGDKETVIRSGLLQGKPWEQLDMREQLQVVKAWHHFYIIAPLEGIALSRLGG